MNEIKHITRTNLILLGATLIAGCAAQPVNDPRQQLRVASEITVSNSIQAVYRRVSKFAGQCYAQGTTGVFSASDRLYYDSREAEVKFLVAGFLSMIPEVKVWVDIKEVDANTTLVSVKYDHSMSGAWKAWADAVPYFAENEYSGCPMVTNNPYKPVMPPKP